ncbi:MAG: hypothetical protein ABFD79_17375, partial [Phycisphaerales bacterium]
SNQDSFDNVNGETQFYFNTDNSPCTSANMAILYQGRANCDGMRGIGDYINHRGYRTTELYNQLIYGYGGISAGFTFEQYKAQIDSSQGVLLHFVNEFTGFTHTMYGYGYDDFGQILVYDGISPNGQNPGFLSWGGYYFLGGQWLAHYGVTVINLDPAPEPATVAFFFLGIVFILKTKN